MPTAFSISKCGRGLHSTRNRNFRRHFSIDGRDQIVDRPLRIFISAGEPSGDIIGSKLMKALKRQISVELHGIGGSLMQHEGLQSLFNMNELSVMGFAEVIPHFFKFKRRIQQAVTAIKKIQPDAIVTIDSKGFHYRLLKRIKDSNIQAPTIHYVGPTSVWLSNKDTSSLGHIIDHLLLLYPFEPKYYAHVPYGVTYVGHPLLEDCIQDGTLEFRCGNGASFRSRVFSQYSLDPATRIIGVLPGSRKQEVDRMLPLFMESTKLIQHSINRSIHLVVPTVPPLLRSVQERLQSLPKDSKMTYSIVDSTNPAVKYDALAACDVAMAASGTVVIELAMARVPTVAAMTFHPLTNTILHLLRKYTSQFSNFKYATIPNIILEKEVVEELLLESCTPSRIAYATTKLLEDETKKSKQMEGFKEILSQLVPRELPLGQKKLPSEVAASAIVNILHPVKC